VRKVPKKKLQSAHINSLKVIRVDSNYSNQSLDNPTSNKIKNNDKFFSKRNNNFRDFKESKLKDILDKIENKKQYILQIENKYISNDGSAYKCKVPSELRTDNTVKNIKNHASPPTISRYSDFMNGNLDSNEKVASRNHISPNILSAFSPAEIKKKSMIPAMKKKVSENCRKRKQQIAPLVSKTKPQNANIKKSHRYLNSWEQGGIAQVCEDDIKEELSGNDDSAFEKKTPREEGSAARRLLESMSKFAADEDRDFEDGADSDCELNEESSAQLDMIRSANSKVRNLKYGQRPYSPPFLNFHQTKTK